MRVILRIFVICCIGLVLVAFFLVGYHFILLRANKGVFVKLPFKQVLPLGTARYIVLPKEFEKSFDKTVQKNSPPIWVPRYEHSVAITRVDYVDVYATDVETNEPRTYSYNKDTRYVCVTPRNRGVEAVEAGVPADPKQALVNYTYVFAGYGLAGEFGEPGFLNFHSDIGNGAHEDSYIPQEQLLAKLYLTSDKPDASGKYNLAAIVLFVNKDTCAIDQ